MKNKLLIFAISLISFTVISQESYFIGVGFDPKLAITGAYSYDHSPVLDISVMTGMRWESNFEFAIGFEYANLKPYYLSSKIYVNYVIPTANQKWSFATGPEILLIERDWFPGIKKINTQFAYGWNATTSFYVSNNISIRLVATAVHRTDLVKMYNEKVFLKLNGEIGIRIETKR